MKIWITVGLLLTLGISACSLDAPPTPDASSQQLRSLEVYLARAALFDAEFEQYKITGDKIFVECGKLKHGRQIPLLQEIIELPPEVTQSLKTPSMRISELNNLEPKSFDEPGKAQNFADPGICTVRIDLDGETTEIKTSLDQITEPNSRGSTQVKKLLELLRAQISPLTSTHSICSNADFYGLGGIKPGPRI